MTIYQLVMNPMRDRAESMRVVADGSKEYLVNLWKENVCEPYTDSDVPNAFFPDAKWTWRKQFKKGGPLEWFNPEGAFLVEYRPEPEVIPMEQLL
jgi:hypothetical protein